MRKTALLCAICSLFVFTGCSTITINSDYDSSEEFTWYKTFALYDGAELPDNALNKYPQLRQYVDEVVREVLLEKGFIHEETGDTDFIVYTYGILTGVKQSIQLYSYRAKWRGDSISRGRTAVELTQVALVIDVVNTMDQENKKLTWRGGGGRVVEEVIDDEATRKRLKKNITKILAEFPPD